MGAGAAYAMDKLLSGSPSPSIKFYPKARINEGTIIRQTGSACIDTSDGFFSAISNIMSINNCGVRMNIELAKIIASEYKKKMDVANLPFWFLLAGPHGEFELIFSVNKSEEDRMIELSQDMNWEPIRIGEIISQPGMELIMHERNLHCEPGEIANLYGNCAGNLNQYINALFKIDEQWNHM
jgi:thiamine-monophosphate kinase